MEEIIKELERQMAIHERFVFKLSRILAEYRDAKQRYEDGEITEEYYEVTLMACQRDLDMHLKAFV